MKKLYVGNLSYNTTDQDLMKIFSQYGGVSSATVIRDKFDNSSKGFAFVEMEDNNHAETAMSELDGSDVNGRNLKVNEAKERTSEGRSNSGGSSSGKRW